MMRIQLTADHRDDAYWQNPLHSSSKDFRLMVKRVFITSDLGEDALPKWANWVKVVIDGGFARHFIVANVLLPSSFQLMIFL